MAGCTFPAPGQIRQILERLIKLIDEGDAEVILAEDALVPKFNELLKYDLVVVKDDRVFLTEKGRLAKTHGFEYILAQERLPKKVSKRLPGIRLGGRNYTVADLRFKLNAVHLLILLLLLTMTVLYFYLPLTEN